MSESIQHFVVRGVDYTVISDTADDGARYHRIKLDDTGGSQIQVVRGDFDTDALREICESFQLGRELGHAEASESGTN